MKKLGMSALLLILLASATTARPRLPMINDNYDRAVAEAKQRHVPLFIDVWAPW